MQSLTSTGEKLKLNLVCQWDSELASPLPGDGSIYIRDDYLIIPAPEIDCAIAATGALILGGHTEHHIVRTLLQLQAGL